MASWFCLAYRFISVFGSNRLPTVLVRAVNWLTILIVSRRLAISWLGKTATSWLGRTVTINSLVG